MWINDYMRWNTYYARKSDKTFAHIHRLSSYNLFSFKNKTIKNKYNKMLKKEWQEKGYIDEPIEEGIDLQSEISRLAKEKDAVVSFLVGDIHHLDMGTLLDRLGIAVRTGHHCAQPLMERMGVLGTVRASVAIYNTREEVDALVAGVKRVSQMF